MIPRLVSLLSYIILIFSFSTNLVLAEVPAALQNFEAVYTVYWRGIRAGQTIHRLHKVGNDRYSFDTRTDPILPILPYRYNESTQYIWKGHTIQPQYFQYAHREGKKRREGTIIFDWLTGQISSKLEGEPWPFVLHTGIQDKLTHSLMLRYDLKNHPAKSYTYSVADDDSVKEQRFDYVETVPMQTPFGKIDTILLRHISSKGRETKIWFAKDYDYLPVRLTQSRCGKVHTEANIKSYSDHRS